MAYNVHANAARPVSIEEKRIPAMLQRAAFRSDSGRCHATAQPNGEGIHGEFTPLVEGNSWEFMGIHGNSRQNPVLSPLPHEFGLSSEASIFLRKTQ